jgi:hypothetical protein
MNRAEKIAAGVLIGMVLACGSVPKVGDHSLSSTPPSAGNNYEPTSAAPQPPAYTPRVSDFSIEVIETKKDCFGEAGCNITYEINPSYTGQPLDPSITYKVIFTLSGGDSPETGSFDVQGKKYNKPSEEMISTPSSSSELTARVTRVVQE